MLLDLCRVADDIDVILSEHILIEFTHHATVKFGAPVDKVEAAVVSLREWCELVEPAAVPPDTFADPDDRPVIGTAVAGRAECLVTGDRDLQALGSHQNIAILSPRAFYDRLR